jgi:hypothetical protein
MARVSKQCEITTCVLHRGHYLLFGNFLDLSLPPWDVQLIAEAPSPQGVGCFVLIRVRWLRFY